MPLSGHPGRILRLNDGSQVAALRRIAYSMLQAAAQPGKVAKSWWISIAIDRILETNNKKELWL